MICENCGKEHLGNYGSGRFCSKKCARTFSTKNVNHNETKIVNCNNCGKELEILKNSKNNVFCEECSNFIKSQKIKHKLTKKLSGRTFDTFNHCWFCGKINCDSIICKNKLVYNKIGSLIKYFDFDKSTIGTTNALLEFERIKNKLYTLYYIDGLSSPDLDKLFNYPSHIVQHIFPIFNFSPRTNSESVTNSFLQGKCHCTSSNKYKHGWHTTWNNKKVYYRSQNELDFAFELDNQQIDYEMEYLHIKYFDTQKNDYRCAIPDFYIPSKNEIVEIKSSYTLDLQNMCDKFKAYKELGYNCKCICDYNEIKI